MPNIFKCEEMRKKEQIDKYRNSIIWGDSLDVMRRLPTGSIDLIITSPPYNLKNSSGNGMKDGRGGKWKSPLLLTDTKSIQTTCHMVNTANGKEPV